MEFGMKGMTDEELDRLLTEALRSTSEDFTSASERLKERIDKEIAVRAQEFSSMGRTTHGGKCSFATICLNLYEGIEAQAKRKNVVIRCLPKDDAFEKCIMLNEYVFVALEYVFSNLIGTFGSQDSKILISTEGSAICIKGLNISEEKLQKWCVSDGKTFMIDQSDMGVAVSFLKLKGIDLVASGNTVQIAFSNQLHIS